MNKITKNEIIEFPVKWNKELFFTVIRHQQNVTINKYLFILMIVNLMIK